MTVRLSLEEIIVSVLVTDDNDDGDEDIGIGDTLKERVFVSAGVLVLVVLVLDGGVMVVNACHL